MRKRNPASPSKKQPRTRTSASRPGRRPSLGWFARLLRPWYDEHKRPLPWRSSRDPYAVWLSEVILQQTRVDQGTAYWERFIARYPTVADLAAATEADVLKLWQGLGYYSRARNLLHAARAVVRDHGGSFPRSHAGLMTLKGVGDYSAAAIGSICFEVQEAVVDGNVLRVLARVFGIDTPVDSTAGRKLFRALAQELLDTSSPGEHNQAVMELGALVCTPKDPACPVCPLRERCIAFASARAGELPVKTARAKTRARYFNYLWIPHPDGHFMHQRVEKDIWHGLFEPPLLESGKPLTASGLLDLLHREFGEGWRIGSRHAAVKHVLSHQVIHAVFWEVSPPRAFRPPGHWIRTTRKQLHELAVPRLIERWIGSPGT